MSSSRSAFIVQHQLGALNCGIARKLGFNEVARSLVSRAIKRFKELGNEGDRPGRGRKRTVNTSNNRKIIKKRVQRNSMVSMRKIARETGINRESVRLIAKKELGLKPYKLQKCQLLTDENKKVRLERCRSLQRRAAGTGWEKIVFTDEKLFTVEQAHNHQNDRNWSTEAPGPSSIVEHRQNPRSVMVWGGICASGKTPLIFIDQGVKINKEVYRQDILEAVVLPWSQQRFGDDEWTFQQYSAPPTEQKQPKSGAKPISPLSLLPKMATLLKGSESPRLQRMVDFGSKGLCKTPQNFGVPEASVASRVGSHNGRRTTAYSPKFFETFELVYSC